MANPQIENGHIDVANEIADHLCRYRISGEEWMVLWVIIRKTYGWKKKDDRISLSQFAQLTGLKRQAASRALNKLSTKKIIAVIKNDDSGINIYKFNKHFDEWMLSTKKMTVSTKKIMPVNKKDNRVSSLLRHTKDTITKDTITKEKPHFNFPEWINKETWAAYREMRTRKRAPLTDRAASLIIKELDKLRSQGFEPEAVLNQSIMKSWTGVFPLSGGNGNGRTPAYKQDEKRTPLQSEIEAGCDEINRRRAAQKSTRGDTGRNAASDDVPDFQMP